MKIRGLWYRCSVSLLNKHPPSLWLGLASPQWSPCWPFPPPQLLLSAGWGFLVLLALLCVGGVGFRVLTYRAQFGRVGGSRVGLSSFNKIPCHHEKTLRRRET